MTTKSTDEQITERLKKILKLETRISEKYEDIQNGDVSPFFLALFGPDIALITKVAHSIQTTFGMSFYEQVCEIIGESKGYKVKRQYKILGEIDNEVSRYLDKILDDTSYKPNRQAELEGLKKLVKKGRELEHPDSTVDVFIKMPDGREIYIDVTTVKPNKKEFRTMKRKILTWAAMRWSIDPDAKVEAYMAIPYNPESADYTRWNSYYDRKDLLVGDELWSLVSGGEYNISKLQKIFSSLKDSVQNDVNRLVGGKK